MTDPILRELVHTRRHFITAFTASAAGAVLPPLRPRDVVEDMAAAERLIGLEFNDAERKQGKGRTEQQRRHFTDLRNAKVEHATAPIGIFDPLPPGAPPPPTGGGAQYTAEAVAVDPTNEEDLAFASVHQLAALLEHGKVTSRRLVELCIARLERHDPKLHCVVTLLRDEALAAASRADAERAAGRVRGPLHGIPFGAKDLFAHPGAPTTFGATPFRDQLLDVQATVLQKLADAGAVLVAKLSLGALAQGDVWFGGTTRNPWKPDEGSSGSSAGTAAAVAAGLLPFGLGTETLGSIVSPCARCGVTGLRSTFGTISRHGAMALSWTMDKVGPIARHAADCALVFDAIRGPDGKDPSVRAAAFPWRRDRPLTGMSIGYLDAPRVDWEQGSPAAFLEVLRKAGAKLAPVQLPKAPYRAMLIMLHAEAATAFDELLRSGGLRTLDSQGDGDWPNSMRTARFIPAVEYLRAARLRAQLVVEMAQVMAPFDALVSPPYEGDTLTCTNLTGHPACVLPHGQRGNGTLTAMTVIGKLYGEASVLAVAEAWQRATQWHALRPPLT